MENKSSEAKKQIKELTISALFLAFSGLAMLFQIPIYSFLRIDFSGYFILLSFAFISFKYSFIIGLIVPIFLLIIGGDLVSILTILVFNTLLVIFHYFFFYKKNLFLMISSSFLIIILLSIIMTVLNIIIFTPAYYGFDYSLIFSNITWFFIVILPFNLIKLAILYFLLIVTLKILDFKTLIALS